ncbi:MAG: PTS sugar transporter subunit IIA [Gemmatimonadota bacterium]
MRGIVLAHADLAAALVRAVEQISGVADALTPISNEGLPPEELHQNLEALTGGRPVIIFADLASGSCAFASRVVQRGRGNVAVVTGASLPMLLDFVFHREMPLEQLVPKLVKEAQASITAHLNADRPVSG